MVEKPWSAVTKMSVLAAKDGLAVMKSRICLRFVSAFLTEAFEVGPLIPGVSVFKLSPWFCCVPFGSRDQNTATNGSPVCTKVGSMALVKASAKYCCCVRFATRVPGVVLLPEKPLLCWLVAGAPLVRLGATVGKPAAVKAV